MLFIPEEKKKSHQRMSRGLSEIQGRKQAFQCFCLPRHFPQPLTKTQVFLSDDIHSSESKNMPDGLLVAVSRTFMNVNPKLHINCDIFTKLKRVELVSTEE